MFTSVRDDLRATLDEIRAAGLHKPERVIGTPQSATVEVTAGGRPGTVLNFCANNYLGLADHPEVIAAAHEALDRWGYGMASVRFICGTQEVHKELEARLSAFLGQEDTILYSSCFDANGGVFETLLGPEDAVISDALNHASIIDGIRLSKAQRYRYANNDMADLELKQAVADGTRFRLIATDGVFSMDGDIAKLPEIVEIAKEFDLIVYVDDAHGSGVTGKGAGTVKHFGLEKEVDFQIGTLSKAIGVVGGYVAGKKNLIDWLKVRSRPFLFSTAVTPADAAAAAKAIEILMESTELNDRLWENGRYLKQGLKDLGFDIGHSETPITPCIIGDEKLTQLFSKRLYEEGVYAKAIVYPTVPRGTGRVRNMPTAAHTKEMLDQALSVYEKVGKELGIL